MKVIKYVKYMLTHPEWKWAMMIDISCIVSGLLRVLTLQLWQCRWETRVRLWAVRGAMIENVRKMFPGISIQVVETSPEIQQKMAQAQQAQASSNNKKQYVN